MKTFTSLTDFKKKLAVGDKLEITRNGEVLPIVEVSKAQSNSFAVKIQKPDGTFVNSWLDYPSATHCRIESNSTLVIRDQWVMKGDATKGYVGKEIKIQFA